jgi:hypothetical protein
MSYDLFEDIRVPREGASHVAIQEVKEEISVWLEASYQRSAISGNVGKPEFIIK